MTKSNTNHNKIIDSIEKVLVTVGGHKDYHAKILASAILNVLVEEGLINKTGEDKQAD